MSSRRDLSATHHDLDPLLLGAGRDGLFNGPGEGFDEPSVTGLFADFGDAGVYGGGEVVGDAEFDVLGHELDTSTSHSASTHDSVAGMTTNDPTAVNWSGDITELTAESLRDRRNALANAVACNVIYGRSHRNREDARFNACIDEECRRHGMQSRVRELADELDAVYPNVSQSIRAALGDRP